MYRSRQIAPGALGVYAQTDLVPSCLTLVGGPRVGNLLPSHRWERAGPKHTGAHVSVLAVRTKLRDVCVSFLIVTSFG